MSGQVTFDVYRGAEGETPVRKTVTRELRPNDVFLEMTHSGVCGTDLHFRHADITLGHEGVGIVKQVGPAVKDLKVGDVAGFGYIRQVCGNCMECLTGKLQLIADIGCNAGQLLITLSRLGPVLLSGCRIWQRRFRYR